MIPWEYVKEGLQSILADWDVTQCDIDRPPKEVIPEDGMRAEDGMRQFEPGDYMRVIIYLKKKDLGEGI